MKINYKLLIWNAFAGVAMVAFGMMLSVCIVWDNDAIRENTVRFWRALLG